LVELGYGVSVHLCEGHASAEFQTQRSGRDFVLTLQRLWHSHGCLSVARSKALRRHLAACSGAEARPRPGSYAWPELRQTAEAAFAAGNPRDTLLRRLHEDGPAHPPSERTMRRCTPSGAAWRARPEPPSPRCRTYEPARRLTLSGPPTSLVVDEDHSSKEARDG
jgi:hypothetical protein